MKVLTDKKVYHFFVSYVFALIFLLLSGLVFSEVIVHDFKKQLFTHDYEVAGYLIKHGMKPSDAAYAFTGSKSKQEISEGEQLLNALGYKADVNNSLVPDAGMLLLKYRMMFMLIAIFTGILIFTAFFIYFRGNAVKIQKAVYSIQSFMDGDTSVRIGSEEEGNLSKLFASINMMATSLNTHIEVEKRTKLFLKDTISDISHQLKTPLAALKMYNEIMIEESANEDTIKKFSQKTANALERMENLIKSLLKITKLDSGTVILNKKKENVESIMQKIAYSFETRAEKEQKTITLSGSHDAILYCDANWMTEAVSNLVKNALDHTESHGKINVSWEETQAAVKIIVKDNGKGIHTEDVHHIFKRFYRSRFSQDTEGIGLGLSLAKSITEAHNGTISVESELGKGSTFTMNFLKTAEL